MAKKQMPMMPFFVRDYISATRHLSLEQRGAYTDLLFFQWDMGVLPSNHAELARMLGASLEHFSSIWPSISDKFVEQNGVLKNLRVENERKISIKKHKSSEKKAINAAKARWRKEKSSNASSIHQALLEQCPPSPSPYEESKSADPPSAAQVDTSTRSGMFSIGKSILGANSGGLISAAISRVGEAVVGSVIGELALKPKADPRAYFVKATQPEERKLVV